MSACTGWGYLTSVPAEFVASSTLTESNEQLIVAKVSVGGRCFSYFTTVTASNAYESFCTLGKLRLLDRIAESHQALHTELSVGEFQQGCQFSCVQIVGAGVQAPGGAYCQAGGCTAPQCKRKKQYRRQLCVDAAKGAAASTCTSAGTPQLGHTLLENKAIRK